MGNVGRGFEYRYGATFRTLADPARSPDTRVVETNFREPQMSVSFAVDSVPESTLTQMARTADGVCGRRQAASGNCARWLANGLLPQAH